MSANRFWTYLMANLVFAIVVGSVLTLRSYAQVKISIDHNKGNDATAEFKFKRVPSPVRDDAAAKGKLMMVDGVADPNGANITALTDGVLPINSDQPSRNFFFNAGTGGGRLRIDLGSVLEIAQVNTYSWHSNTRAAQLYKLWASDGSDPQFNAAPKANINPATCGWKAIAVVDTRSNDQDDGGQYGVSITDRSGSLGRFRYLLLDCYVTEIADDFGNTFYSEVDVVARRVP